MLRTVIVLQDPAVLVLGNFFEEEVRCKAFSNKNLKIRYLIRHERDPTKRNHLFECKTHVYNGQYDKLIFYRLLLITTPSSLDFATHPQLDSLYFSTH